MVNEALARSADIEHCFSSELLSWASSAFSLLEHSCRSLDLVDAPPFLVVAGDASFLGILSPPSAS